MTQEQLHNAGPFESADIHSKDANQLQILSLYSNSIIKKSGLCPLEQANVKCKYSNEKSMLNFLFDGRSKASPVSCHLQEICSRNVSDLDL